MSSEAVLNSVVRELQSSSDRRNKGIVGRDFGVELQGVNSPYKSRHEIKLITGICQFGIIQMDNIIVSNCSRHIPESLVDEIACVKIPTCIVETYLISLPDIYRKYFKRLFKECFSGSCYVYIHNNFVCYDDEGKPQFCLELELTLSSNEETEVEIGLKKDLSPIINVDGCLCCQNNCKTLDKIFCLGLRKYVFEEREVPSDCPLEGKIIEK